MESILSNTVAAIAIISFAAGIVKYTVINPLQTAISALNEAVKELKTMLDRIEQDQKSIDRRLVVVEESTKSAHKRIDGLEGHFNG